MPISLGVDRRKNRKKLWENKATRGKGVYSGLPRRGEKFFSSFEDGDKARGGCGGGGGVKGKGRVNKK